MFTLEVLQADHGEAMLLRFGDGPGQLIVLDAGPTGIYRRSVQPRLRELRVGLAATDPLEIERVIVSHMDDDHIQGLLELFDEIEEDVDTHQPPPYRVDGLWLNAFDLDDLGVASPAALTAAVASVGEAAVAGPGGSSEAVVESIPQARELASSARTLEIPTNADFESGLAMATPGGPVVVDLDELTLTVIGPNTGRIDDLKKTWKAWLAATAKRDASAEEVATAALSVDRSVYNLSSIVILAERKGLSMLLTGDGLGQDILADLDRAGRLQDGRIHVDLLKMPHHGSIRNVMAPADLLERITADNYVFSANGRSGNPDPPTIERLVRARGSAEYTMWFTNADARIDAVLKADRDAHKRHYQVEVRPPPALLLAIELEDSGD